MQLTFLGTGASTGIPVLGCTCDVCQSTDLRDKRLRSSAMLQIKGKNILIDCGPDFRQQFLQQRISRIDAIVFTHEHHDHTSGLDELRSVSYFGGSPIEIYASAKVCKSIEMQFPYLFSGNYFGSPQLNFNVIENKPFTVCSIPFIPILANHTDVQGENPVFGYRTGGLTYITDAKYIAPQELEKVEGSQMVVINALSQMPHFKHLSLSEAIDVLNQLNPGQAYFTHISHMLGKQAEITKQLPEPYFLAYDFLSIQIDSE